MSAAAHALRFVVRAYQLLLSPVLAPGCRFEPSCSDFAMQALGRFGAARGARLTAGRLLRCRPGATWGYDPVPEKDGGEAVNGAGR